jgi:hypothetical protein
MRRDNAWFKLIALALTLVLLVPILVACGGSGEDYAAPTLIVIPTNTPHPTPTLTQTPTPTPTLTPTPTPTQTPTPNPTPTKTPYTWELTVQNVFRLEKFWALVMQNPGVDTLTKLDDLAFCWPSQEPDTFFCTSNENGKLNTFSGTAVSSKEGTVLLMVQVSLRNISDTVKTFALKDIKVTASGFAEMTATGIGVGSSPVVLMILDAEQAQEIEVAPNYAWTISLLFSNVPKDMSGFELRFLDMPSNKLPEPS